MFETYVNENTRTWLPTVPHLQINNFIHLFICDIPIINICTKIVNIYLRWSYMLAELLWELSLRVCVYPGSTDYLYVWHISACISYQWERMRRPAVCFSGSSSSSRIPILKIISLTASVSPLWEHWYLESRSSYWTRTLAVSGRKFYVHFVRARMNLCLSPSPFNAKQVDSLLARVNLVAVPHGVTYPMPLS